MEMLDKAIRLCAEIEERQAELRAILIQIKEQSECGKINAIDSLADVCTEPDDIRVDESEPEILDDEPVVDETVIVPEEVKPVVVQTVSQPRPAVVKSRPDLRKAFTINDRFRFRRELFAGDDAALVAVIDHLSTLNSLEEADRYLSTMPWDSEGEAFGEFMTIVSNYFNALK